MIYDRRNANRICVLALAGLLTVAFHAQAQTCSSSKEPNHGTCGDSCHEPGIFITIGKPTDTPVKPPQPKKPVIVPGGGGLYIIGKTDGTTPPKNPPPVNCDNDSVNNVVLYVYRDTPYWTLPMADWPEGENPRSPKFVFGKKRPISVEVHALLNTAEMEVDVTNLENREWLHITCKNAGRSKKHAGYYVYRHVESDVLNLAEETVKENEKKIKVIEEEILEFEVVGHPDTKVSYMVDRGECATATALNNDNNYNKALVDSSEYFWQQATAFGPLTTAWWNAGRALNSPNFGPFVRAVGNDGPSKEADVMLLGSHGSYRSALSSQGQVVFTPSGGGLRLKPDAKHAKDYNDQFKYPDEFYYDENAQYVRRTRTATTSPRRPSRLATGTRTSIGRSWSPAIS